MSEVNDEALVLVNKELDVVAETRAQLVSTITNDPRLAGRDVDPVVIDVVAHMLASWWDTAAYFAKGSDYYHGLVTQCGNNLGPLKQLAYTADDGTVNQDVLCAKVPELVAQLAAMATPMQGVAP